jgi:hypothetical protein
MRLKAAAVAFGLVGIAAAAYGAFGTMVVLSDWLACSSQSMAGLASIPDCRTIPWPRQFGIGAGLILVGVVGLTIGWWCLRRARACTRDKRAP